MTNKIENEKSAEYNTGHVPDQNEKEMVDYQEEIIDQALEILQNRIRNGILLNSAADVKSWLHLKCHKMEREVFGLVVVDNQHHYLGDTELFYGTVDGARVHPREVVKYVLELNGVGVMLYHNHPSGSADASQADLRITEKLKSALKLIDVRVLDHLIVGDEVTSMAEKGLI